MFLSNNKKTSLMDNLKFSFFEQSKNIDSLNATFVQKWRILKIYIYFFFFLLCIILPSPCQSSHQIYDIVYMRHCVHATSCTRDIMYTWHCVHATSCTLTDNAHILTKKRIFFVFRNFYFYAFYWHFFIFSLYNTSMCVCVRAPQPTPFELGTWNLDIVLC